MEMIEKVAYLKGLAEGLALDTDTKEGKLIAAIIDVLDDIALEMEDMMEIVQRWLAFIISLVFKRLVLAHKRFNEFNCVLFSPIALNFNRERNFYVSLNVCHTLLEVNLFFKFINVERKV